MSLFLRSTIWLSRSEQSDGLLYTVSCISFRDGFQALVFKKASPLTVVFIHQGYENSYILLELWTKFQASLSKNHPPVEVSLSRTPVLYPRDSCWHCFLTSHWIRAGHNWIPRGSMQCGEKKESQASWLHDCGKLITEACEGWRKASSDRSGWIFCHSNTVWSDKGSPKKGWKKYASWQKLSKSLPKH